MVVDAQTEIDKIDKNNATEIKYGDDGEGGGLTDK
jgi:hypothetical protein